MIIDDLPKIRKKGVILGIGDGKDKGFGLHCLSRIVYPSNRPPLLEYKLGVIRASPNDSYSRSDANSGVSRRSGTESIDLKIIYKPHSQSQN
jgi:hypothetical protein